LNLIEISTELNQRVGIRCNIESVQVVSGGSINSAYKLLTDDCPLFLKTNKADSIEMFQSEAEGLQTLRDSGSVEVPEVIDVGCVNEQCYLALKWIDFVEKTTDAEIQLGSALANQHRCVTEQYGWHRDNTIGSTLQINICSSNWIEFFRDRRLCYQLELAEKRGLPKNQLVQGYDLLKILDRFFEDRDIKASLLHGDLWSGNWGCDISKKTYVYDPAVYYGDRESDLAMTRLFGGFSDVFYSAYNKSWQLDYGWEKRLDLYNLYHLLNHFNLFGHAYLEQVATCLQRLGHWTK
tara:strand:+ start:3730 stop:4611 length:882 start_codon:yes stop_codon:yes gene_type:complete